MFLGENMFVIRRSWYELLKSEFEKPYYKNLENFLQKEYATKTIYPRSENVFNAINQVPLDKVKVVIIGQDPYHEPNQAHGLSFSVEHSELPPSLKNIFKEIETETGIKNTKGNLTAWAKQGVLLLNTVLTVERGKANSHKGMGWENITLEIVKKVNELQTPVVFLLWGSQAQKFAEILNNPNHLVLKCAHPSPLSAYNGFFGCGHFIKTNDFLVKNNQLPINWSTD